MSTDYLNVYVTYPSRHEAESVSRMLLKAHLAACANMMPGASLYWWDGAIQSADEIYVLYKTTRDRFSALEAMVVAQHSYEVPCIVAWPLEEGHAPYLNWVAREAAG